MSERISWITPSGQTFQMTGQDDIRVQFYRKGAYAPPFSFKKQESPPPPSPDGGVSLINPEGSILTEIRTEPRPLELEFLFRGKDRSTLRKNIRTWISRFNPLLGEGRIQVDLDDGGTRYLKCRYTKGMEGEEIRGRSGDTFQFMIGVFEAVDPYWYDGITEEETFYLNSNSTNTLPISFPFSVSRTTVFDGTTIINTGDIDAYPVWEIRGPGDNLEITNETIGSSYNSIGFKTGGYQLEDGEIITIDCRPGAKTVWSESYAISLYNELTDGSYFFPLLPGENFIKVQLSGANDNSYVNLKYNNRYLTV